jgi:choline dehydrogenase-like flavoprotein
MTTSTDEVVHDVVIVGAGMVGSIVAAKLAAAGVRDVVILEAGPQPYFDWTPEVGPNSAFTDQRAALFQTYFANQLKFDNSPFTDLAYAPSPMFDSDTAYFVQHPTTPNGQLFDSTYMRMVGGTTYHWLGIAIRMLPSDFRMHTIYNQGVDWPITYDELEPWYRRAEVELGVAGDDTRAGLAWRSSRYPMPPIPQSHVDRQAMAAVASDRYTGPPLSITPTPVARNSLPYDGRPACAGSTNCTPLCPIQAKYDASVHLKRALGAPHVDGTRVRVPARLRLGALVTKVVVDATANRRVDHLEYIDVLNGMQTTQIRARRYIIAAHAVETAKILLMSNGVANASDQVGRNLMDHPCQVTWARTDPVHPFRGPLVTSTIDDFRDGPSRRHQAAIRPEIQNVGWQWPTGSPTTTIYDAVKRTLANGRIGRAVADTIRDDLSREVAIDSLIEQLPSPHNRVQLAAKHDSIGLPRPELHWTVGEYTAAGGALAASISQSILVAMGADPNNITFGPKLYGAGHLHGTHRMGDDPTTSVTDSYGVTHEHDNLSLIGCGSFPTIGTANPTLTLVALALRSAERLVGELQDSIVATT